jgi:hypothetical protein
MHARRRRGHHLRIAATPRRDGGRSSSLALAASSPIGEAQSKRGMRSLAQLHQGPGRLRDYCSIGRPDSSYDGGWDGAAGGVGGGGPE